MIGFAVLALALVSSGWVFADARQLGAKRGALGGGFLDAGAFGWLVGCLICWAIVFPCYFLARRKLVRAKESRDTPSYPVQSPYDPNPDVPWPMLPAYAMPAGVNSQPGWHHPYVPIQQRRGRAGRLLGGVLAGALVAGLVGWRVFVFVSGGPSQPNAALPVTPLTSPTPAVPAHGIAAVLEQDALRNTDFQPGYTVQLDQDGDLVLGQVTLANCGYNFTSERHRVARRAYEVHNPDGQYRGVNNELVAYDKASEAALALRQWHKAAQRCTRHTVHTKIAGPGTPHAKEHVTRTALHDRELPNKQNILTLETIKGKRTLFFTAIIQRRGRILDCVEVLNSTRPDATEIDAELHLAIVTGLRLRGQP